MRAPNYGPGAWVVYRKTKFSSTPGPRARAISATKGDMCSYVVDKFWVVAEVIDEQLRLVTRKGKQHVVAADDPNLRPARLLEKVLYRNRYRDAERSAQDSDSGDS